MLRVRLFGYFSLRGGGECNFSYSVYVFLVSSVSSTNV